LPDPRGKWFLAISNEASNGQVTQKKNVHLSLNSNRNQKKKPKHNNLHVYYGELALRVAIMMSRRKREAIAYELKSLVGNYNRSR